MERYTRHSSPPNFYLCETFPSVVLEFRSQPGCRSPPTLYKANLTLESVTCFCVVFNSFSLRGVSGFKVQERGISEKKCCNTTSPCAMQQQQSQQFTQMRQICIVFICEVESARKASNLTQLFISMTQQYLASFFSPFFHIKQFFFMSLIQRDEKSRLWKEKMCS